MFKKNQRVVIDYDGYYEWYRQFVPRGVWALDLEDYHKCEVVRNDGDGFVYVKAPGFECSVPAQFVSPAPIGLTALVLPTGHVGLICPLCGKPARVVASSSVENEIYHMVDCENPAHQWSWTEVKPVASETLDTPPNYEPSVGDVVQFQYSTETKPKLILGTVASRFDVGKWRITTELHGAFIRLTGDLKLVSRAIVAVDTSDLDTQPITPIVLGE